MRCSCAFRLGPVVCGRFRRLRRWLSLCRHLGGNRFSGTLPSSWMGLTRLEEVHLRSNELTGTLPASWARLTALEVLDASFNDLSGQLPSAWAAMHGLQVCPHR